MKILHIGFSNYPINAGHRIGLSLVLCPVQSGPKVFNQQSYQDWQSWRSSERSVQKESQIFLLWYLQKKNFIFVFIYFQREERGGRTRGREKSMCERYIHRLPLIYPLPTGNLALNPGTCPTGNQSSDPSVRRPALNPLSHTSQGLTKSYRYLHIFIYYNHLHYPTQ